MSVQSVMPSVLSAIATVVTHTDMGGPAAEEEAADIRCGRMCPIPAIRAAGAIR
ncbi:hypothetical protein [Nonomuraea sp. NPDC049400]|uniref:hypothetical protein n=1 Tax=Nonomuraea sp. NPDC049400 TaxID=3364352 RepID=UPI00379F6B04